MKATYIDTAKMNEIGTRINSYASEYEREINAMFRRMTAVPYDTKEWVGNVAERHANLVALEKDDFLDFSKRIKAYGNKIINDATAYDNRIKSNEVEEKK